jgi:hypothetical protein
VRVRAKKAVGKFVAALDPQCRFERALLLLGHMRCGSTALANIICSRPDYSGYGEGHIEYSSGDAALGMLAVNQFRRAAWQRTAPHLFDKILHNRYDQGADPAFFEARALFVIREPKAAIASIRKLFASLNSSEYPSDAASALYYRERLEGLRKLWPRFSQARRMALSYETLVANPERALADMSRRLSFDPPLENNYRPHEATRARGAGDPVEAAKHDRILPRIAASSASIELDLPAQDQRQLGELYQATLNAWGVS